MNNPILFLIFNRPDTTQRVFNVIKQIKPKKLFIAADGPRKNKTGEKELCEQTRNIVLKNIGWDCEVQTLFRNENLGCGKAVSGAINWFFENVNQGIILEDDCLPSKSFFNFCDVMLEKYRNEEKIMMISGYNPATSINNIESDYFYSKVYPIWGWATWKRAWKLYDKQMIDWPNQRKDLLKNHYKNIFTKNYFMITFDNAYNKLIDTWDYQWTYSCIKNNSFCLIPKFNMVSNIGITGTHTSKNLGTSLFRKTFEVEKNNYIYPQEIKVDEKIDDFIFKISGVSKISLKNIFYLFIKKLGLYNKLFKIKKKIKK